MKYTLKHRIVSGVKRLPWIVGALLVGLGIGWVVRGGGSGDGGQELGSAPAEEPAVEEVWTCSMHPQFRLPEFGLCPICNMDLIPADTSGGGPLREITFSEAERARMRLRTVPVARRPAGARVRLTGKVDYDETRLTMISSWVPGRVDRLFVDYTGLPVREGDHVAELYSPELFAAQEELLQALSGSRAAEESGGSRRRSAEATLRATRRRLELWGLSADQVAEVEERGTPSEHQTVYAPSGGIVIEKHVKEGMYVQTGMRLLTLADLSEVWVMLDAYESDLVWLRYGQPVRFTTQAWPGETFEGILAYIDPLVDSRTRTVRVRVNVDNARGMLKPGMFVHALVRARTSASGKTIEPELAGKWTCPMHPEVISEEADDCPTCGMPLEPTADRGDASGSANDAEDPLLIPVAAALLTGRRAIVYVEVPGEQGAAYRGREVVLGPRAGDQYVVLHGLEEGERVVVEGNFKIDSALQLRARPSMMSPDTGLEPADAPSDAARFALGRVEKLWAAIGDSLDGEDLFAFQAACGALEQLVREIDPGVFGGSGVDLWEELRMRLANCAVLGMRAWDLEEAGVVATDLGEPIALLRSHLGSEPPPDTGPALELEHAPRFLAAVAELWRAYEELRARLAGDDFEGGKLALGPLAEGLEVLLALGEEEPRIVSWLEKLETAAKELSAAGDMEKLRYFFRDFSRPFIALASKAGTGLEHELFIVRCPMAFDDEGGRWLQSVPDVMNPYYGDQMYRCGSVIGQIEASAAEGEGSSDEH